MSDQDLAFPFDDSRPIPEVLAEFYNFKLAYHDTPEGRFYAIQDWIIGVARAAEPRKFWDSMKRRLKRAGIEMSSWCRQLPYRAADGKKYRQDHASAEGLYIITQRMDAETGIRSKVLQYLAKSGVLVDEIRRDPYEGAVALLSYADQKDYHKMVSEEGFPPEEALQWLNVRHGGKEERLRTTATWKARGAHPHQFAILTNRIHAVALGRTATEHKRQLDIKETPRKYISAAENMAITVTEVTARNLHEYMNSYGFDELADDIDDVRPMIDSARPHLARMFSQKPRRLPGANKAELPE